MIYISLILIFFIFAFSDNYVIWGSAFILFLTVSFFYSKKSLRITSIRLWIGLVSFFLLMSFKFDPFYFSYTLALKNTKILLHFYLFNVTVNVLNDNLKMKHIYDFFIKRGMKKTAFYIIFSTVVFRKLFSSFGDIFLFYKSENRNLSFVINIPELIYSCIRECVRVSFSVSENFILRRIYEK